MKAVVRSALENILNLEKSGAFVGWMICTVTVKNSDPGSRKRVNVMSECGNERMNVKEGLA
jgi:hypothetical protein